MKTDDVLERFHAVLVGALRQRDPDHLNRPFTVAEIYQDLVPYATFRDQLGLEMNGDYEHALLRLLSGEADFVHLESEHALKEIREELGSSNPNTGLYRDFAAVDVRLNPARIADAPPLDVELAYAKASVDDLVADGDVEEGGDGWDDDDSTKSPASKATGWDDEDTDTVSAESSGSSTPLDPEMVDDSETGVSGEERMVPDVCLWCRETLPKRDNLNFCPYCGTDVRLTPCASCGEALEPDWRFCIACGTKASGDEEG